jgi:very-short-patch-repair endonuclease
MARANQSRPARSRAKAGEHKPWPRRRDRDVPNVAAARGEFRRGRIAPVDVAKVVARFSHQADQGGDNPLAAVAALQLGLVQTRQLRQLGLSASAVRHRVRRGRLHPVHRGVYAVGSPRLTTRGEMMAAVLACPSVILSDCSALALWTIVPPPEGAHNVTAPKWRPDKDGIRVHVAAIPQADLAAIDRIPLTAPARSLLDFAASAGAVELERAVNEARVLGLLPPSELERLRARTPGHHGWGPLNRLLASEREPGFSRSEAERRLLALIRSAGLPEPRRNARVGGYEVDLLWPEHGLVVEVDGYAFHGGRHPFERDRRKATELQSAQLDLLPITWLQIAEEPTWVVASIATVLAARRPAAET